MDETTTNSPSRGRYKNYTATFKVKVISECDGNSIRSVAKDHKICESTIGGWISKKDKLVDVEKIRTSRTFIIYLLYFDKYHKINQSFEMNCLLIPAP